MGLSLIDDLVEKSWTVQNDWATPEECAWLRAEAERQDAQARFRPAGLADGVLTPAVRSDRILWLQEGDAVWPWVHEKLTLLRAQLNAELFLGLDHFEAHFAVYEPGQFYAKHLDRKASAAEAPGSRRAISFLLYLNDNWQPEDGGELVIHDNAEALRILPEGGRMVLFRSDTILHEVLAPKRRRYSLTAWLRTL